MEKNLFIYGGEGIKTENHALLILNLEKWEWSYPSPGGAGAPEPRKGHSAAIFKNRLLIFGGWGTRAFEYFDDMWILDLDSLQWFKAKKKGPVPAPRAGHASVVFKDKLFVWGGWGSGSHPWNEIHYMDVDDFTWLKKKANWIYSISEILPCSSTNKGTGIVVLWWTNRREGIHKSHGHFEYPINLLIMIGL